MELNELKNKWKALDEHVKAQDEKITQLTNQIISGKVKSPLKTLRRHCIVSAVFVPFLLPFFYWAFNFIGLNCPQWQKTLLFSLAWLFVGFIFLREVYFVITLNNINISKETTIQSLQRTIRFRRLFHWGVLIGLVFGVAFLSVAFASLNEQFMYGGFIGGIIGLLVGAKLFRFYNRTINNLEEALREWNEDTV